MGFLSYPFLWIFLPASMVLYWVTPRRARCAVLLALNLAFYLYGPRWQIWPLLGSTVLTYAGARAVEKHAGGPAAKRLLAAALTANFALLLGFKLAAPALPLGLSFYIFSGSGYLIDVYRGHIAAQKSFLHHAAFITFFPTISAGPILRAGNWHTQLDALPRLTLRRLKKAMLLFLWGAFLKLIIADRIAQYVDAVYRAPQQFRGYYLLLAMLLYSLQIYADFAGYSMMALGMACALGFDLPDNFRQPYLEGDIAHFWRCWHISLTSWFRDYLYIPLGGNRKGAACKYRNILIVFLVSGAWHGAGATFLVWGALHALYQIVGEVSKPWRERLYARMGVDRGVFSFWLGRRVVTYLLVSAAWVFFRAGSVGQALTVLWRMFWLDNPWILFDGTLETFGIGGMEGVVLLLALLILLLVSILQRHGVDFDWFERQGSIFQGLLLLGLLFAVVVYGIYGPAYSAASFIYAAF